MTKDAVNTSALGALRPGDPVSALSQALGERWREPRPFRQGLVDAVEHTHHFTAQVTQDGHVGRVAYGWGFDKDVGLSGLQIGMSIEAARRARSDLEILDPIAVAPHLRNARLPAPNGYGGWVEFNSDRIVRISFGDPEAIYPPKIPVPYPAVSGAPGAPFADPNLKLVVLSELLHDKVIDLGEPEDLAKFVLGREVDLEDEGYDPIEAARDYLARYPLTPDLLAAPKQLIFDGGGLIYRHIHYFWGGETDEFDVRDLHGIEHLAHVETIHVTSMLEAVDLAPLLAMPALRLLRGYSDYGASEAMKQRNAETLARLERRGVAIQNYHPG